MEKMFLLILLANFVIGKSVSHLEYLENVSFPFNCEYQDGIRTSWDVNRIDVWLECKQFSSFYFNCLEYDLNHLNPVYLKIPKYGALIHECVTTANVTVPCDKKLRGTCSYLPETRDYCKSYEDICKTNFFCPCLNKDVRTFFCQRNCKKKITCDICDQIVDDYGRPELELQFEPITNTLFLHVKNYLKLKILNHGYRPNCISDVKVSTDDYHIYATGDELFTYEESFARNIASYRLFPKEGLLAHGAPGRFWCMGFMYPTMEIIKSNLIIANFSSYADDFAVNISMDMKRGKNHVMLKQKLQNVLTPPMLLIRVVEILPINEQDVYNQTFIFHFTSAEESQPLSEAYKYTIYRIAVALSAQSMAQYILDYDIASTEFCMEENTRTDGGDLLHWPMTKIGEVAYPRNINSSTFEIFLQRRCEGEYVFGAYWSTITQNCCTTYIPEGSVTENLEGMLESNATASELIEQLETITLNNTHFQSYDVYLTAQILEKIASAHEYFSTTQLVNVINLVMDVDIGKLNSSQYDYGATDLILRHFDIALENSIKFANSSTFFAPTNNVLLQITDLQNSSIIGVSFYEFNGTSTVEFLTNDSIESIKQDNLKFALILPPKLLEQIENSKMNDRTYLVTALFKKDTLFTQLTQKNKTNSWIPGVFVHGFEDYDLLAPYQLFLKPTLGGEFSENCAFWDFNQPGQKGTWTSEKTAELVGNCKMCEFWHTTHFGLLVGSEDEVKSVALNIITAIGCCLSIIGILGILLTIIVFNKWRYDTGSKILVHFSVSILIQMMLLFVAGSEGGENKGLCLFIGISLHYSILAQFFWIFVISYLQYRRFVYSLSEEPANVVFKACLIGWVLPAVLVLPVPLVSQNDYIHTSYCYLDGKGLLYGILLPVTIIICINLAMFFRIFFNMWCRKIAPNMSKQMKVQYVHLQIRLAVFLFFLMGFTWIFGLLSTFFESLILSYLFCVTGTMQGLVLFIFHIIMNKKIRYSWGKWIHSLRSKN